MLSPPPEKPGRRRLSWTMEAITEQSTKSMTLEEMRVDLVQVVREYVHGDDAEPLLLHVPAGGGKTYSGIAIAQSLAAENVRIIWAAARHVLFSELWMANDLFDSQMWYHWRPMKYMDNDKPYCRHADAQDVWMRRGYRSFDLCHQLCQADGHISECLYRAQAKVKHPIVFAMHQHLASGLGIQRGFDVALVDELPLDAFLDENKIPTDRLALDTVGPLQELSERLERIAASLAPKEYIAGKQLLDEIGHVLTDVFAQIEVNDNAIPRPPNIRQVGEVFDVPHFWIMRFLLIAEQEWQCWRNDWETWIQRISLSRKSLRLLWRKSPWAKLPQKLVALDATSRPAMYEKLFSFEPIVAEPDDYEPEPLQLLDNEAKVW